MQAFAMRMLLDISACRELLRLGLTHFGDACAERRLRYCPSSGQLLMAFKTTTSTSNSSRCYASSAARLDFSEPWTSVLVLVAHHAAHERIDSPVRTFRIVGGKASSIDEAGELNAFEDEQGRTMIWVLVIGERTKFHSSLLPIK
eukprot:SAG11_NODE_8526_length_1005_cov_1.895143_1_plen_145_part_00